MNRSRVREKSKIEFILKKVLQKGLRSCSNVRVETRMCACVCV